MKKIKKILTRLYVRACNNRGYFDTNVLNSRLLKVYSEGDEYPKIIKNYGITYVQMGKNSYYNIEDHSWKSILDIHVHHTVTRDNWLPWVR